VSDGKISLPESDAWDELIRIDARLREIVRMVYDAPILVAGQFVAVTEEQRAGRSGGLRRSLATREEILETIAGQIATLKMANDHLKDRLSPFEEQKATVTPISDVDDPDMTSWKAVERTLGRPLVPEELVPVASLQSLTDPELRVATHLARVQLVVCATYLRALSPIRAGEMSAFIHDLLAKPATCAYPGCGKPSTFIYGQAKIPMCDDHAHKAPRRPSSIAEIVERYVPDAIGEPDEDSNPAVAGSTGATTVIAEPLLNSVAGTDSIVAAIAAVRVARKRRVATGKAITTALEAHELAIEQDKEAYDELQRAEQKLLDLIADGDSES